MSVIAWDGRTLAADSQATCADMRQHCVKIQRLPGVIVATTGQLNHHDALVTWWCAGAKAADAPAWMATDEWTRLVVVSASSVIAYERWGLPNDCSAEPFFAWGSGRDFAMGALAHGATAEEAVAIACRFSINCGLPVVAHRRLP